jgi:hypothetical protein
MRLVTIESDVRNMIKNHLATGVTLYRFCADAGLHHSQIWMFLNHKEKGLTSKALVKIGRYFENKRV